MKEYLGCEVDRYTFCERGRADMENGKNQMQKNGYWRSNSRNGYWKNGAAASVNRYVKDRNGSRFRSQSNGAGFNRYRSKSGGAGFSKDRSGSQPKQKSELAKDVEEIKKDINEIKEDDG